MKMRKNLGAAICFVGCVLLASGLLATVLPLTGNAQVQRIIASLEEPVRDGAINAVNAFLLGCIRGCYVLLIAGVVLTALGGVWLARATADEPTREPKPTRERTSVPPMRRAPPPVRREPTEMDVRTSTDNPFAEYEAPVTRDPLEKYRPHPIIAPQDSAEPLSPYERPHDEPKPEPVEKLREEAERARRLAESSMAQPMPAVKTAGKPRERTEAASPKPMPLKSSVLPSSAAMPSTDKPRIVSTMRKPSATSDTPSAKTDEKTVNEVKTAATLKSAPRVISTMGKK